MKSLKVLTPVLVLLLILSFTVTTVVAQAEVPPVGQVDEDGDLIIGVFPEADIDPAGIPPIEEDLTLPEGSVGVESIPYYPVDDLDVYTKYPIYGFSHDVDAFKYRIEVVNPKLLENITMYLLKGPGDCAGETCTLTPVLPLKPYDLTNTKGYYGWNVSSKTDLGWGEYSLPAFFYVLKNGFNSTFTTLDSKWWSVYGTWTITDTGYAKTLGEIGKYSSGIEKHLVSENFVYEVKMKRKNTDEPNYVYFQAYPLPLSANKFWDDGYLFAYSNSGLFSLSRTVNGASTILATGSTDLIKPFDWNKISIKRGKSLMTIWINGNFLCEYYDSTYSYGYVGLGMYKLDVVKDPLLVDWARLEYTTEDPYPAP